MTTNKQKILVTEVAFRDAHQSLFATRMRTDDMLEIAEELDQVGYWSVECWGGATFDSCIRYLKEDPWERARLLKKAMPNTRLQMLLRGQNLLGYRHYADDVVRKFVERAAENGIDVFRIFDALNDLRNLDCAVKAVKLSGKHAQGAISYTTSPVHTIEGFIDLGKRLEEMGCDSICIKDMAGLITPGMAYQLVKGLKEKVSIPINLHSHTTTGMAATAQYSAIKAGLDMVDTAISSLSLGSSHPPTETVVAMLDGTPFDTGLDMGRLNKIADYFRGVRENYSEYEGRVSGVDTRILVSQVPGGMLSNLESQLREQGAEGKMGEVLAEIPRVRKELGYPPLVTPTSQIVGTQAVLNVLQGERYKTITAETRALLGGYYGATPAPVDRDIQKKALGDKEPITCRPADLLANEFEKIRKELGSGAESEEDVLTYALFPKVAKEFFEIRAKGGAPAEKISVPKKAAKAVAKGEKYTVVIDGVPYDVLVHEGGKIDYVPEAETHAEATAVRDEEGVVVVNAPLAGRVIRLVKRPGDRVEKGDVVLVIEAMKMETEIKAAGDGVIRKIFVLEGDDFSLGAPLYLIKTG